MDRLPPVAIMLANVFNFVVWLTTEFPNNVINRIRRRRILFHRRMINNHETFMGNLMVGHRNLVQNIPLRLLELPYRGHRGPNKIRNQHWWEVTVQQHFDDNDWIANFRMRRETFETLCDTLSPSLQAAPHSVQEPLTVRKKVALTLYKLASCCEYRLVANQFGVHKSTVHKTFYAVVKAINNVIMPELITLPDSDEARAIAEAVQLKYSFPQTYGFIDGSHIPILPPLDGYRDYVNRKGWPSVILQAVVDHRYRFRNISCNTPGSAHDARVLALSSIFQNAENLLPVSPKVIDGLEVPLMIAGDPAYPLLDWLVKGYTQHRRLSAEEESFNVYLSSARMAVEIAFGRLKARWRCLLKRLDIHYEFVPHVVAACCTLHNLVENNKEQFMEQWMENVREADNLHPQPEPFVARARDANNMVNVRDHICRHLAATVPLRQSGFRRDNRD